MPAALLAALVGVGVLTGCGGSAAPTRATYGKKVDKVCSDTQARVSAIQGEKRRSNEDLVRFADDLGKALDDGVRKLREVDRPDGADGEKARRWLDALARDNATVVKPALAELAAAARRGDVAGMRRAAQKVQASNSARVDELGREAGVERM